MLDFDTTLEILDSTDFVQISATRQELVDQGKAIVPQLIKYLENATIKQALNLMLVLGEIGDHRAIDSICNRLINGTSSMIRAKAAEVLGIFADPHTLPCLVQTLYRESESEMVLMWVVDSIGRTSAPEAYEALVHYLTQIESSTMRYMTIRALGIQGNPNAIDHILPYLDNDDRHVRRDTELALEKLGYRLPHGDN